MTVRRELYSDTFDTDGDLQAPWIPVGEYPLPVVAGGDVGSFTNYAAAVYDNAIPYDHWCEAEVSVAPDYDFLGEYFISLSVRTSQTASGGYLLILSVDGWILWDLVENVSIVAQSELPTAGSVWRLEAQGTTLRVLRDDVEVWSGTDTTTPQGQYTYLYFSKQTSVQDKTPGRFDNFKIGDWTADQITITKVGSSNNIIDGNSILVEGDQLDGATAWTLKGHGDVTLTEVSSTETQVELAAVDLVGNNYPFGAGSTLEVTDGTNTSSIGVSLEPMAGYAYSVGASVDTATGLAQAGGTDGDQWLYPLSVSASALLVQDDTNFVLDSPVPDNTTFGYQLYSGGAWDTGDVNINRDPGEVDVPAEWSSQIPPISMTVGVPTSGDVSGYANGSAPLSFFEVLQQKPGEVITRSDGTWSGYAPTADSFQMQWKVSNNANQAGANSNLLTIDPVMPTISDAKDQNASSTGSDITVTTPSVAGTMYWVADPSSEQPTAEQIEAGLNAAGNPAEMSGSWPITAAGQQPWQTIDTGRPGVKYYYWIVQVN